MQHFVRVGLLGQVGRFHSAEAVAFRRGTRVICETARGLEVGDVLASADGNDEPSQGTLVRPVSLADDLLLARLARRKEQAFQACQDRLAQRGVDAVLIDVEPLFDGRSLCFYFLGEVSEEVDRVTAELAETYESEAQVRRFADTLTHGCGPLCGTESAAGQGCASSGCSSCAVAGACGTGPRRTSRQEGA